MTPPSLSALFLFLLIAAAGADVYLHNPRGSNDRLKSTARDRRNANRLFDSQNNARGGYNVGGILKYIEGSNLQIEWTSQHSCGNENNHCEMILQYMCSPDLRDGNTENTIPKDEDDEKEGEVFGMHESREYYRLCRKTQRNKGYYTADQNLRSPQAAVNTRQNPKGTRSGLECPEERDYYPYKRSSPWVDIAVLTNKPENCQYYREQAALPKEECAYNGSLAELHDGVLPQTKEACENFVSPFGEKGKAYWKKTPCPDGVPLLDCRQAEFSRDNHNGNGPDGFPITYNWTIPQFNTLKDEKCVLRIRYNISTGDYDAWGDDSASYADNNRDGESLGAELTERLGLENRAEAARRGYTMRNNPVVQVSAKLKALRLQLAINTAQFGRTFQDRSHVFKIAERPSGVAEDDKIFNVAVRGKRGNIVEVYPAVEYDFVPNSLQVPKDSYIHFQWTGSDTNNGGNDGQGTRGTDRSNVVIMRNEGLNIPCTNDLKKNNGTTGCWSVSFPGSLETEFLGFPADVRTSLALVGTDNPGVLLNDAPATYNAGLQKATRPGEYHYMCTRNNNFSNRQQKGRIIVIDGPTVEEEEVGILGGQFGDADVNITVDRNVFDRVVKLRLIGRPVSPIDVAHVHAPLSNFYSLTPEEIRIDSPMRMSIQLADGTLDDGKIIHVMAAYKDAGVWAWTKIASTLSADGVVEFEVSRGGVFYVAEGGNALPPRPAREPELPVSEVDKLIDKLCDLLEDDADDCKKLVEKQRAAGKHAAYILEQIFEEMKDVLSENGIPSVPVKRDILDELMDLF